jgi:hypothetical protein
MNINSITVKDWPILGFFFNVNNMHQHMVGISLLVRVTSNSFF